MNGKPSWQSSTLSQLLVVVISSYALGCLWLIVRGQPGLEGLRWLVEILLPLYGVKRGVEAMKNGGANGVEPVKPAG